MADSQHQINPYTKLRELVPTASHTLDLVEFGGSQPESVIAETTINSQTSSLPATPTNPIVEVQARIRKIAGQNPQTPTLEDFGLIPSEHPSPITTTQATRPTTLAMATVNKSKNS